MAANLKRKLLVIIFCLASITQGMYSTYFVSILTTIERIYQIQSKTAGAILSATEIGQILGSLLIAYYGGRGNKPKWIAACMALSAIAALISITPHFLLASSSSSASNGNLGRATASTVNTFAQNISSPYLSSDLTLNSSTPTPLYSSRQKIELPSQLCLIDNLNERTILNSTQKPALISDAAAMLQQPVAPQSFGLILVIFFICLLAIGFGSTAITTLGIPFIDDIVSKEESPLYLGLTIGLKIFGPALGFLLGSFCINLNLSMTVLSDYLDEERSNLTVGPMAPADLAKDFHSNSIDAQVGAWWLGLIIISLPLLILALPMYILSKMIADDNLVDGDDFGDITYQAAEDHDIGGSHDFQSHILGLDGVAVCDGGGPEDLTSNRTCFSSEIDSSSREVLQSHHDSPVHRQYHQYSNYGRNIGLERPILIRNNLGKTKIACVSVESANGQPLSHIEQQRDSVDNANNDEDNWRSSISAVVNHFSDSEPINNFTNDEAKSLRQNSPPPPPSSSRSTLALSLSSYANKSSSKQQTTTIADLSSTLSRLIKNKLLLLRMLSGILHILPIAGFYTFLPKYLIEQFRITSSSASAISGLAGILFVGLGAFLGGTIVRFFNVNSKLMTRWIATSALLYAIGMIILMYLGCSKNQTVYYNSSDYMSTDCYDLCKCTATYNPVCANGTTYMSPCLAGCRSYTKSGDKYIFDECGCSSLSGSQPTIDEQRSNPLANITNNEQTVPNKQDSSKNDDHINLNVATQGHCLFDCDNLIWYIVVFSISTLVHASCEVGSMMFNLRCVNSGDRALALGLTTFSSSLLGTIPCSVIYGTIVDFTCVYWDSVPAGLDTDASRGACRAYDNDSFRFYLHAITALVMFMAFIVDCYISRRADEVDFYSGSKTDIHMKLKKSTETI